MKRVVFFCTTGIILLIIVVVSIVISINSSRIVYRIEETKELNPFDNFYQKKYLHTDGKIIKYMEKEEHGTYSTKEIASEKAKILYEDKNPRVEKYIGEKQSILLGIVFSRKVKVDTIYKFYLPETGVELYSKLT